MVTFLITSGFIVGLLAIAVYYWQKPNTPDKIEYLPPEPNPRSLFPEEVISELPASKAVVAAEIRARAQAGDTTTLKAAREARDFQLYQEILELLVNQAEGPHLLALVSFVCRNELPINVALAEKYFQIWMGAPDRNSTAQMLHVAALSDDAQTYGHAVDLVLDHWRDDRLSMISSAELAAIIESEFWILSSATRSSGAGFGLKETLASARRELAGTRP